MQSIENNMIVSSLFHLKDKHGILDYSKGRFNTKKWVKKLGIKLDKISDGIQTLSGGNQQKVVLGKWLETNPRVIILNGPTVGVDIGAKFDIHNFLRQLAREKEIAIILISDDISEVLLNCNRILIIKGGRIEEEFINTDLDIDKLQNLIVDENEKEAE